MSLVPVGFNIAHVLFVCRQLRPETGTGYWYQKTGQCVRPFSNEYQPTRGDNILDKMYFSEPHHFTSVHIVAPVVKLTIRQWSPTPCDVNRYHTHNLLTNRPSNPKHETSMCCFCSMLPLSGICLLYTSPSPRDGLLSRMPSSA